MAKSGQVELRSGGELRPWSMAATDTLAEAGQEMEAINFEKKQLLQQWKSSLIGMAKRDEALQAGASPVPTPPLYAVFHGGHKWRWPILE